MKRVVVVTLAALATLSLSLLIGGTDPSGRVLLSLGLPGPAARLLRDPGWKGVAAYRARDFAAAADAFRSAGMLLNLGNAEVHQGRYAAALEAYDVARLGGDAAAGANFDLVAAFYAGQALDPDSPITWASQSDGDAGDTVKSSIAQGNARAAGAGDESVNSGALFGLPELESHGRRAVRKVFDEKFVVANRRWLATLSDVPGDYLAARIAHEHKRRRKLGLAQPEPEDPR